MVEPTTLQRLITNAPFWLRLAHGGQGVGGFAGLGDGDDEIAAAEDRIAIAELGGLLDFGVDVGEILERVFADQSGVQRGAAADEDHAVELGEFARRGAHAGEHGGAEVEIEAAADGVGQRVRLLVDFLEHEMFEAALLRGGGVEAELGDLAGDRDVVEIADVDGIRGDDGDVVVVQIDHPLGVGEDGGGVGGDDGFPVADADDDRDCRGGR